MIKNGLFISIILFLMISTAQAHGPVRQKSSVSAEVTANADKVWAVLQNYSDMSWHPMVDATINAQGGNKKGASRTLSLTTGGQITQIIKLNNPEKMKLKYRTLKEMTIIGTVAFQGEQQPIRTLPVTGLSETIIIKNLGSNKSKLSWGAAYYRGYMNNLRAGELPELNDNAANSAMIQYLTSGILGLMKTFDSNATEKDIEKCSPPVDCKI